VDADVAGDEDVDEVADGGPDGVPDAVVAVAVAVAVAVGAVPAAAGDVGAVPAAGDVATSGEGFTASRAEPATPVRAAAPGARYARPTTTAVTDVVTIINRAGSRNRRRRWVCTVQ
jgi:hypothetical protein